MNIENINRESIRKKVEEETLYERSAGGKKITDKRMQRKDEAVNKFDLSPEKDVNFEKTADGREREGYRSEEEKAALEEQMRKYEEKQ